MKSKLKLRRCNRKKVQSFLKELGWYWRPPMKLRKVRLSDEEALFLWNLRAFYVSEGEKRLVTKGYPQYQRK